MKKLVFLILAFVSITAEAQFVGGGGRRVTIIIGGDSSGTAAPLTPQRITTALGYTPLNPNIPITDPAWIQSISKAKVGLGNVDNTSDLGKPLSTAAINALAAKLNTSSLGLINGQSLVGSNINIVTNDASLLSTGTIPNGRLSTDVTRNQSNQALINKTLDFSLNTATNLPMSSMPSLSGALAGKMGVFTPTIINGTSVTAGATLNVATPDAASITNGVFDDARFPVGIARYTGAGTFTGKVIDGDDNTIRDVGQNAVKFLADSIARKVNVADLAVSVNGIPLRNGGAPITLPGGGGGSITDASALTTGTLNAARLPSTVVQTTAVSSNPGWLSITPSYIGLGNVSNTSDADKPVSTAQSAALAGKAGLSTSNTFTGANNFSLAPSMPGASLTGDLAFSGNLTRKIGAPGTAASDIYSRYFGRSGTVVIGPSTASADLLFQMGASGANVGAFKSNTGNFHLFAPGANPTEKGARLYVDGPAKITGGLTVNPDSIQTFATNSDAIAEGVKPGGIYKTIDSNGEWILKIAHPAFVLQPPTVAPTYTQSINTGTEFTTFDGSTSEVGWKAQNSGASWSFKKATNTTRPIYRFEVRPDDWWDGDRPPLNPDGTRPTATSSNSNYQNNGVKERSEIYQKVPETTPLDVPIWTSWSFMIEGDPTIDALNPAGNAYNQYGAVFYGEPIPNKDFICDLGQWHGSPANGAPHWGIDLSTTYGKDTMDLNTVGGIVSGTQGQVKEKATWPITRNVWHSIVVRAVHSNDAVDANGSNGGQISLWLDGQLIFSQTNMALGYTDGSDAGYMKFGVYRTKITSTRTTRTAVQYANMEISTSDLSSRILNPLPLN